MRNLFLQAIILISILNNVSNGQTKKQQIVQLNFKNDSLTNVIDKLKYDNDILAKSNAIMDAYNISYRKEINSLNQKYTYLMNENMAITDSLKKLKALMVSFGDSLNTPIINSINVWDFPYLASSSYTFKYYADNESLGYPDNLLLNGKVVFPAAEGYYKNGYKNGHWTYYLCDRSKKYEGNYLNGKKNGKWTKYTHCMESLESLQFKDFPFVEESFSDLYMELDYYRINLDYYRSSSSSLEYLVLKEELTYVNGIPSDTIYYRNAKSNKLILKVAWKNKLIFYDNNRPFSNTSVMFYNPYFSKLDKENVIVYDRDGNIIYTLNKNLDKVKENYYGSNGDLIESIEYNSSDEFGLGKYGSECPCQ